MVGLQVLVLTIGVRIPVPEPRTISLSNSPIKSDLMMHKNHTN